MSESRADSIASASALRERLRHHLSDLDPSLRPLAAGILGDGAPIDFVARDGEGRATLVLVAGLGEDTAAIPLALAQRAWLRRRIGDWLQFAPGLGLRPEAGVRCLLVAPSFSPITQTAVSQLPPGDIELFQARSFSHAGVPALLLERVALPRDPSAPLAPVAEGTHGASDREPLAPAVFRSGLSDADLNLSDPERRDFDS